MKKENLLEDESLMELVKIASQIERERLEDFLSTGLEMRTQLFSVKDLQTTPHFIKWVMVQLQQVLEQRLRRKICITFEEGQYIFYLTLTIPVMKEQEKLPTT